MSDLTKLTVNLLPQAVEALDAAAAITGDSKTDTVNRALQLYHQIVLALGEPHRSFVFDVDEARSVRVTIRPAD